MQLKGIGSWVKEKLHALRGNEKGKAPTPAKQAAPRIRFRRPWWVRNLVHPTAGAIARGRTLNPKAVAMARAWRINRITALFTKIQSGKATPKDVRELRRISS